MLFVEVCIKEKLIPILKLSTSSIHNIFLIFEGNPNDKILYPRAAKRRSASFPTPRSLERRHSLRLFGSSKRLQRCASTRSLSKTYAQTLATDSSSSEYQSTDSSSPSELNDPLNLNSNTKKICATFF